MNLGSYAIDDLLTFTAQTQVFATGVATDADAAPAYRIYEDETTAPLLTGTMALLDASNTAGLYSEQVTLSAANGFEKGKCYTIQITATVSSVAGATIRVFQVGAAVDAKHLGGTAQTGRDIGASVLLSSGTGAGQVKLSSGYVAPNWGDVGNPTTALNLSGTTVKAVTDAVADSSGITTLLSRLSAARAGYLDNLSVGAVALEASLQSLITTVGAAGAGLTAADDAVIAAIAALNNLSQANVRTALGLATANLDTQLAAISGYIDTEVAAIKAKTDNLPTDPADASDIAASFASLASTLTTIASYIDTEVAAIKAKTDNLPAAPAATGDIPSAAAITTAVWAAGTRSLTTFGTLVADIAAAVWAAVTRTLTSGAAPSAADVADAVWDEATAGHVTAGSTGAALSAAGSAGDPWLTDLPNGYTGDQAGAIIGRFNAVAPTGPVTVVPGAPADVTVCRVYGYFEDLANVPSSNIPISFKLNERAPVKSERLITDRIINTRIIGGTLVDRSDKSLPYQDLQRNDNLTPAGTKYLVNCAELGFVNEEMTLDTDLFDLSTLVT